MNRMLRLNASLYEHYWYHQSTLQEIIELGD